jgi:hypothetical protein
MVEYSDSILVGELVAMKENNWVAELATALADTKGDYSEYRLDGSVVVEMDYYEVDMSDAGTEYSEVDK